MRLERSAYLLLFYCDQVDLPILLSVSSAVVLLTSEVFKGHANQSRFPCQPRGCVPHFTPNDVWLFLIKYYNNYGLKYRTKGTSHGTGTLNVITASVIVITDVIVSIFE